MGSKMSGETALGSFRSGYLGSEQTVRQWRRVPQICHKLICISTKDTAIPAVPAEVPTSDAKEIARRRA